MFLVRVSDAHIQSMKHKAGLYQHSGRFYLFKKVVLIMLLKNVEQKRRLANKEIKSFESVLVEVELIKR